MIRQFLLGSLFLLFSLVTNAQEGDGDPWDFSWGWGSTTGPMLPNQVNGLTEIQPSVAVRFSLDKEKGGAYEFALHSSNAEGATWYNASFGIRGEVPFDVFLAIFTLGIDHHMWTDANQVNRQTTGGHTGLGLMTNIAGDLFFRTDMTFFVTPGTMLYIGFGFEFRYPSSGDGTGDQN